MLIDAPRHNEALSELIKASINDNFRSIPDVGVAGVSAPPQLGDQSFRQLRKASSEIHSAGTRTPHAGYYLDASERKR